jgi:hypothetical protein
MNNKPHSAFARYFNAADAGLEQFFGTDIARAGIATSSIESGYFYGVHPEDFALSLGDKYRLRPLSPP